MINLAQYSTALHTSSDLQGRCSDSRRQRQVKRSRNSHCAGMDWEANNFAMLGLWQDHMVFGSISYFSGNQFGIRKILSAAGSNMRELWQLSISQRHNSRNCPGRTTSGNREGRRFKDRDGGQKCRMNLQSLDGVIPSTTMPEKVQCSRRITSDGGSR